MRAPEIADALMSRLRKGHGLSVPYGRRWEIGGCEPLHSVRDKHFDGVSVFSQGLQSLARTLTPTDDGLLVGEGPDAVWVAINRGIRGDGPPDAFLVGRHGDQSAQYIGNTPEVVLEVLAMIERPIDMSTGPDLQVGFPGLRNRELTYVGSWQWGIHGEARDDAFVRRAAAATLSVIRANTE